jgi:hypothetical protein
MQEYLAWEIEFLPASNATGFLQLNRFRPQLAAEVR